MKFIAKAALVLVFAVVVVAVDNANNQVKAHDGHDHEVAQTETQNNNQQTSYNYTAQEGDTYSQIARKAVQTYGKIHTVNLSLAQIVFAETGLTQAAGSPLLEVGQKVELKEDTVKQWVEKAKTLSAEDQAAWNTYVPFVDFNTDAVGQAR